MKVEKEPGSFNILGYLLELMIKIWRLKKKSLKSSDEKSFV
jgi:hypothetical protein